MKREENRRDRALWRAAGSTRLDDVQISDFNKSAGVQSVKCLEPVSKP